MRHIARFLPAAGAFGAVALTSGIVEIAVTVIGLIAGVWAAKAAYDNMKQERAERKLAEAKLADYERSHEA